MNWQDYIGSDPAICHGEICFKINGKATRVMVYLVLEMLEAGETPAGIISNAHPQLTKEHIQAALHYASEVIRSGELIPFSQTA
ncbi:MAG: hypothetical protein A3G91_01115 [Omnitrophica WOR_2 bacterium RIFCSPLOWO2_12_FULL_50_9]|nr:MAG: hypothetical protein A3G91_01115 [Omnitrophica WOR_2 bacterium RIFCSPLOWO2_12_FULL_50_9]